MKTGIYKIVCSITNRIYIGQSIDIEQRKSSHFSLLRRGAHPNCYLQRSFKKYGETSFYFEILEECEEALLDNKELFWITRFQTTNRRKGFNLCKPDGVGKYRHSIVTRQKMSKSKLGCTISCEIREKIRKTLKKKFIEGNLCSYKKSIEIREIPVSQYDMEGLLIKKWISSAVAARELNLDRANILSTCDGKHKHCGGYRWGRYDNLPILKQRKKRIYGKN